jgi:hypothetical protein
MERSDLIETAPVRVEGAGVERGVGLDPGVVPLPLEVPRPAGTSVAAPLAPSTVPPPATTAPPPATTAPPTIPPATAPPRSTPAHLADTSAAVTAVPVSAVSDPRIVAALGMVRVDWRRLLPGWVLRFQGPRSGYQGSTFPDDRRIEVYVRRDSSIPQLAHVIAHELGHAIDVTYFDEPARGAFDAIRGRSAGGMWFVADGTTDFASGAGDFAECFSWMATGGAGTWRSRLGSPPGGLQQVAIVDLVSRATGLSVFG